MKIETEVRSLQDLMRRDPGLDGDAQRLEQLVWLILLRVCTGESSALDLTSVPRELRWESWVAAMPTNASEVPRYVEHEVLRGLRSLDAGTGSVIAQLLEQVHNRMTNGTLLSELVGRVERWRLRSGEDVHQLGRLYEELIAAIGSAGNAGEFYTPRVLTQLMAELVDPVEGDLVLDPAAGTGGMLVSALDEAEKRAIRVRVAGVEKKGLPHLLGATNLVLHGVTDLEAIKRGNLLARPWNEMQPAYDIVLSNPPFGGVEEPGIVAETPDGIRSQETLDLFIARIPHLLRPGGRAAVVVPDGFLFGGGARERLRRQLGEELDIQLLIRFPNGVFSPYTSIASNVLLFRKQKPNPGFWVYQVPPPSGARAFSRTRPLTREHLTLLRDWWRSPTEGEHARHVSLSYLAEHHYSFDVRPSAVASTESRDVARLRDVMNVGRREVTRRFNALTEEALQAAASPRKEALCALLDQHDTTLETDLSVASLRQTLMSAGVTGWLTGEKGSEQFPQLLESVPASARGRRLPLNLRRLDLAPRGTDWKWAPLAAYGPVVGGGTPDTRHQGVFSETDGIPWVTPADLRDRKDAYVSRGRRFLTESGLSQSSAKVLPRGAVLFSTRAPIGYVAIADVPMATNQGFRSVVPADPRATEYIYYLLLAIAPLIDRAASGTTFKEVSGSQLAGLEVPVPTLGDMELISSKLRKLSRAFDCWGDALVAHRNAISELNDALYQAADVSLAV